VGAVRPPALLAVLATAGALLLAGLAACGDEASSQAQAKLPVDPQALATGLTAADGEWRQALDDWLAAGKPPPLPEEMAVPADYVKRTAVLFSHDPRLAAQTLRRLPRRLAKQMRDLTGASRDLHKLAAGWPPHEIRTGPPTPLDVLMPAYREAKRRFDVDFRVLAAVNHVESSFGRARNDSVAGAKGPMQFIPSTWEVYGLGGNINDPHDAILGAANYLDQSGAPESYGAALYHYNPSRLYVDAVLRYAHLIARDGENFHLLYSWEP
jgi:soluble lytic murein transglycosylase-like protein